MPYKSAIRTSVLALLISIITLIMATFTRSVAIRNNCQSIQKLNSYVYVGTQRALKSLPTIAYYKEHPNELAYQVQQLKEQEKFFKPKACANWYEWWK